MSKRTEGVLFSRTTGHSGLLLVTAVTPGRSGDSPMLLPLLSELRVARPVGRPRTRPDRIRGDKAYSSRAIPAHLRAGGIESVIPEPRDHGAHERAASTARTAPKPYSKGPPDDVVRVIRGHNL